MAELVHKGKSQRQQDARTNLSGILNVAKPRGPTSRDVVNDIRRWSGVRRVGHAGTLDPMAKGVLLVCLGRATRISEYLMRRSKQYRAEITLGVTTDTYDAEGTIVSQVPLANIPSSRQVVEQSLSRFVGEIEQVPPIYSALKQKGKPLYKRARAGEQVVVQPRVVHIESLTVVSWAYPTLTVDVTCGPGTYIRSLAYDLGQSLGCGAYLSALTRQSSGHFTLDDAVSLDVLRDAFAQNSAQEFLYPLDAGLSDFSRVVFRAEEARKLIHGQAIAGTTGQPAASKGTNAPLLWRAYSPEDRFLALVTFDAKQQQWLPRKVFVDRIG